MNKLRRTNEGGETGQQKHKPTQFKWSDIMVGPGARAMTIGIVLMILNQFSGCFSMLNYASKIFIEGGSQMPANEAAIVVGVIQLIGACFPVFLVERTGRKVCKMWKMFFYHNFFWTKYYLRTYSFYSSHQHWAPHLV